MKRDCENCKNCVFERMAGENGYISTCLCESKIAELTAEELLRSIKNNECKWFKAGKPSYSDEVSYND